MSEPGSLLSTIVWVLSLLCFLAAVLIGMGAGVGLVVIRKPVDPHLQMIHLLGIVSLGLSLAVLAILIP